MKKISGKKISIFSIAVCLLLTGCENTDAGSSNTGIADDTSEEEMPFDLEAIEASGQTIEAVYSWGIENFDQKKRVIPYTGGELSVDFSFDNVGTGFDAGVMIFIDGIAQTYSLEPQGDRAYIIPVNIQEESIRNFSVYLEPAFGQDTKEHTVYFASMYNPEYRADKEHGGYGIYQQISLQAAWKLTYDGETDNAVTGKTAKHQQITKEQKEYYVVKRDDGSVQNALKELKCEYWQGGKRIDGSKVDTKEAFELQLMGGSVKKYRVSAFIDNKPVAVFDGKEYEDITIKNGKKTVFSILFDADKLNIQDYSSLYFILCPMSEDGYDENFMMEKTNSLILMR